MYCNERKLYVDAIKGFLILLVMVSHVGGVPVLGTVLFSGYMGVFFIMAGYVNWVHSDESFYQFMARKAKRLLLPYLIYTFVLLILDSLFERLSLPEIIRGGVGIIYARNRLYRTGVEGNVFLLANGNSQFWFLPALYLSYGVSWILEKSGTKRKWLLLLCACAAVIMYSFPILMPWSLDTVVITGPLLFFGQCMRRFETQIETFQFEDLRDRRKRLIAVFICVAFVLLSMVNKGVNFSIGQFDRLGWMGILLYGLIAMLNGTIYLFGFSAIERRGGENRFIHIFSDLGKRTITLLGTHMMVFGVMDTFLAARIPSSLEFVYEFAKIVIALFVGILSSRIIQRLARRITFFRYM